MELREPEETVPVDVGREGNAALRPSAPKIAPAAFDCELEFGR
jgi:hypothetical protein